MTETHRHFHDELSQVKVRLLTMSGEAEAALGLAVEALLERDAARAQRVIDSDRVIDLMEVELEEQCLSLLALQQPMARDLRTLVSALKIATDLERVGDHAVNIAQSAVRLTQSRPIAPEPEIVEMARLSREMLSDALEAFIRGDAQAGRDVCMRDDKVDAFWGPSVHWNTYLEQYVMLLNHAKDSAWSQEGIYISFAPRLDDPSLWTKPVKILDGGIWYPQVMGLEDGSGTDKVAGRQARFFMGGVSQHLIQFTK